MKLVLIFAIALSAAAQDGERLIKANDCSSCHAVDREVVGPAYSTVAKHYAGQADAPDTIAKLAAKIRDGGNGMTPHPDLTDAQRTAMAKWILSQTGSAAVPAEGDTKTYSYKLQDGTTVSLDFPLFLENQAPKVTKEVFHGYQLFNSYCYRCHGTDATGSQLAPDLRHSLAAGMKQRDFLAVAMSGKKEQGMPAWAGFLSEDDVIHIFRYVKGRSLDLVSSGRPPSAQD
ncbi:MAG: c-type cytochrome [Bryobacteraceae bacterium]